MRNFKKLPVTQNPTALPNGYGVSGLVPAERVQLLDGGAALSSLHPVIGAGPTHPPILGTLPGNYATVVRAGRP